MSSKLTLDYGLRFVHQQPQYETTGQASNFLPEQYARGAAPVLYAAGCVSGVYPCTGTNRQAMNPLTGQFLGRELDGRRSARSCRTAATRRTAFSSAGQGITKTAFKWPAVAVAPRFGMAYDVTGAQKRIVSRRRRAVLRPAERQLGVRAGAQPAEPAATSPSATRSCRRSGPAA